MDQPFEWDDTCLQSLRKLKKIQITKYWHYELIIVPFDLTDAPVAFVDLMHRIFRPNVHCFAVIFIDDILVYSKIEKEHEKNLRIVVQKTH